MFCHLHWVAAAFTDLPDVVDALHHLRTAEADVFLICKAVGDEIDLTFRAIHRPQIIPFVRGVTQLRELLLLDVHRPKINRIAAPVMLARPDAGMPRECELRAIGGIAAPRSPVGLHGLFQAAIHSHFKHCCDTRKHALAASRLKQHTPRIRRPADHVVVGGMERQLARLSASGGRDEHIVIPRPVGGKRDPRAVGREPRVDVARFMIGEPRNGGTVFRSYPNIAEVAECYLASVIAGVTQQFAVRGCKGRQKQTTGYEKLFSDLHVVFPESAWQLG